MRNGNTDRRMRVRKKSFRGSCTVEAAILLPLAFGVVLFLISCALFLHDRVSACAWVHETAVWEGFQKREEGTRWEDMHFSVQETVAAAHEELDGR